MEPSYCFAICSCNPSLFTYQPHLLSKHKICIPPSSLRKFVALQNVSSHTTRLPHVFKGRYHSRNLKISIPSSTPSQVVFCTGGELNPCLPFQTLKTFPREELLGKVAMVRFDSKLCPRDNQFNVEYPNDNAIKTLKYLCDVGAKVVIVTHWFMSEISGEVFPAQTLAGTMSFTFLSALGLSIPPSLLEKHARQQAMELLDIAKQRNVRVLLPRDFWCTNAAHSYEHIQVFEAECIPQGWRPVEIGPNSLNEITSALKECKTTLWIGPVTVWPSQNQYQRSLHFMRSLSQLKASGCTIIAIGKEAYNVLKEASCLCLVHPIFRHGAVVLEFLKGNTLAGVAALDRAYPRKLDWKAIFQSPLQPLVVDIGSGNGIFALRMARIYEHRNFLGLEINNKLVNRSLGSALELGLKNVYFVSTNATTSFRSIISSYPGALYLVSIQCPNPDFVDPENRWRIVQRSLIEAIVELICKDGKIFLQSDVKDVVLRMKNEFLHYGRGKLIMSGEHDECDGEIWLGNNPFNVFSDWEQHVIASGRPMYRVMLSKCIDFDTMTS